MMNITRPKSNNQIIILHGNALVSPANTLHYFGNVADTATPAINGIDILTTGIITKVYLWQVVSGTLASNETSSLSLRVNDTTSYLLTSGWQQDQVLELFSNTSINVPVTAGDFVEFINTTPNWVTSPTGWYVSATLLLEEL